MVHNHGNYRKSWENHTQKIMVIIIEIFGPNMGNMYSNNTFNCFIGFSASFRYSQIVFTFLLANTLLLEGHRNSCSYFMTCHGSGKQFWGTTICLQILWRCNWWVALGAQIDLCAVCNVDEVQRHNEPHEYHKCIKHPYSRTNASAWLCPKKWRC